MSIERHPDVRLLSSERIHSGRVFDVVRERCELPSGLQQDLTIVDHPGAVAVLALDGEGRALLVRQYRHAVGDWTLEIPAGRVEPGESRLAAAQRELEEETGQRAARWELLKEFLAAPGFCSEKVSIFLALDLSPAGAGRRAQDQDEELSLLRLPLEDLLGEAIADAKTLIGAACLRRRGRA